MRSKLVIVYEARSPFCLLGSLLIDLVGDVYVVDGPTSWKGDEVVDGKNHGKCFLAKG